MYTTLRFYLGFIGKGIPLALFTCISLMWVLEFFANPCNSIVVSSYINASLKNIFQSILCSAIAAIIYSVFSVYFVKATKCKKVLPLICINSYKIFKISEKITIKFEINSLNEQDYNIFTIDKFLNKCIHDNNNNCISDDKKRFMFHFQELLQFSEFINDNVLYALIDLRIQYDDLNSLIGTNPDLIKKKEVAQGIAKKTNAFAKKLNDTYLEYATANFSFTLESKTNCADS